MMKIGNTHMKNLGEMGKKERENRKNMWELRRKKYTLTPLTIT
jgi:3-methyladenine DNA glycosylase AlkD